MNTYNTCIMIFLSYYRILGTRSKSKEFEKQRRTDYVHKDVLYSKELPIFVKWSKKGEK